MNRQVRVSMELAVWEVSFYNKMKENGIALSDRQLQQFRIYAQMLAEWNQKMNLTAIVDPKEVYVKHFLDCILPSFHIAINGTMCDVGAGAGFPSIPLKIVYPELKVTILEPLRKRCVFLTALVNELQLEEVSIINARAEDYAKQHRESFSVVSARAVANLTLLSELCIPLVEKGGIFLAMKGSSAKEEWIKAEYAISVLGCQLEKEDTYRLEGAERVNYCFKKVKNTPAKYPRAFAKIKHEPLMRR